MAPIITRRFEGVSFGLLGIGRPDPADITRSEKCWGKKDAAIPDEADSSDSRSFPDENLPPMIPHSLPEDPSTGERQLDSVTLPRCKGPPVAYICVGSVLLALFLAAMLWRLVGCWKRKRSGRKGLTQATNQEVVDDGVPWRTSIEIRYNNVAETVNADVAGTVSADVSETVSTDASEKWGDDASTIVDE